MISEPTLAELKNMSERSRAELAATVHHLRSEATDTVTELKEKVSARHITQEVKGYLGETRDNLLENLKTRAKENPMQAVAVGVAVAYPLLGLLRRIPMPLVLVGAGFWLAKKNREGSVEAQLTKAALDQAGELSSQVTHQVEEGYRRASSAASGVAESVTRMANDAGSALGDVAGDLTKTALNAAPVATAKARDWAGQVADLADQAGKTASGVAVRLADAARHQAAALVPTIPGRPAKNALLDFVSKNSLLLVGAGLTLGAVIAASVPSSEVEERLAGPGGDFLKDKIRETAAVGIRQATDFTAGIVGEAVASAAKQGITSGSVSRAVENVTAGIGAIAAKGTQAAFGELATAQNSNTAEIK